MPDQDQPPHKKTPPAWASLHLWHMQPVRDILLGLGIFAIFLIGQRISVVTVPLLLAILLAYLFEPVIVWSMKKLSITRRTSVIGIIAAVIFLIVLPATVGATFAAGQLVAFTANTIQNITYVKTAIDDEFNEDKDISYEEATETLRLSIDPTWTTPRAEEHSKADNWVWIRDKIRDARNESTPFGDASATVINWIGSNSERVTEKAAGVGMGALNTVISMVGAAFGLGFMAFLTAFFFFFTATEWIGLKQFGSSLLPDKNRDTVIHLLQKFDLVISGFIRGRITIAFIQAIIFSIGFFLIGVPGAFILGPIVAFLSIVPYLALVGVPISISLLWLQSYGGFRGEIWWVIGAPTAFYFFGQAIDDYVLTPKIQGKSTGMDTPSILFASIAGGALFGFFGMLIAIPIAACVKILIQEIFWPRFKEWAEGRAADPLPIDSESD